jgi:hypothetical protein
MMKTLQKLATFASLTIVALAAPAEPDRSQLEQLSIDDLKAIYLTCNDGVING